MGCDDTTRLSIIYKNLSLLDEEISKLQVDHEQKEFVSLVKKLLSNIPYKSFSHTEFPCSWSTDIYSMGIYYNIHKSLEEEKEYENDFSPIDWCSRKHLLMRDRFLHFVYVTYESIQEIESYINYYKDEVSRAFFSMRKIISQLKVKCFTIFQNNDLFAKSYIISSLVKFIYGNEYSQDFIYKIALKQCWHHNFRSAMNKELKYLASLHKAMLKRKKDGDNNYYLRVATMLYLSGVSFDYNHKWDELVKVMEDNSFSSKQIKNLYKIFLANQRQGIENVKESNLKCSRDKDKESYTYDY